jgi:glucose-1-phosphate cytidylyltransferase
MKVIILCGGKGTRAYPHTMDVPKPLLEVSGRPILSHLMEIYALQGCTDFVLAAGFKIDLIESYAETLPDDWVVDVVDTGLETNTGGRVVRCRDHVRDDTFLTYADGLGDVDLNALVAFHRRHGKAATVTTVPLPSQYGTLDCDERGLVIGFREKPRLADHWINAGFFVINEKVFDHWYGEDLEREVLPSLSAGRQLYAYRHNGFWKSMDTMKDALELGVLATERPAPWLPTWPRPLPHG